MSMTVGAAAADAPVSEMNTTPLIDVMLCLLIMIIYTLPIQTHAIKLDTPRPAPQQPNQIESPYIDLEIDFDGTVLWNGTPVPNMATLQSYFLTEAQKEPQPELHIRPNRLVKYNVVAQVLAIAQRSGIKRMGFIGNEKFL